MSKEESGERQGQRGSKKALVGPCGCRKDSGFLGEWDRVREAADLFKTGWVWALDPGAERGRSLQVEPLCQHQSELFQLQIELGC